MSRETMGRNGRSWRRGMAPIVLAALGVALGAARLLPGPAIGEQPIGAAATSVAASAVAAGAATPRGATDDGTKVVTMATADEIAKAEAELQAAEQELQGKLTRSIPGGVALASPEKGMELKRLREDVEAKRQRLDALRRD